MASRRIHPVVAAHFGAEHVPYVIAYHSSAGWRNVRRFRARADFVADFLAQSPGVDALAVNVGEGRYGRTADFQACELR